MYTITELTWVPVEEFNKLTKSKLIARLKDMNKIIGRRIEGFSTFQKGKGISDSPALRLYRQGGADKLSTSMSLTRQQLQREYMRGLYFLKAESGTASGWYKIQSRTLKSIKNLTGVKIKHKDFDLFWDKYSRLIEERPDLALPENKYEAFRIVAEMIDERYARERLGKKLAGDMDSAISVLSSELDALYEESISHKMDELGSMFKLTKSSTSISKKKKSFKPKKKKAGDIIDVDSGDIDIDTDLDDLF